MKKLTILLLILSFSSPSVATHKETKNPRYRDYDIHISWSTSEVRHQAHLDLARKGSFHAQHELIHSYFAKHNHSVSYSQAIYWYKKVLESQCGWDWITTGIRLLSKEKPENHGMNEKTLQTTLYTLLILHYDYFIAILYKPYLDNKSMKKA